MGPRLRVLRSLGVTIALLLLAVIGASAQIQILSPNGGEVYEVGTPVTVTWTAPASASIRVEYSSDGGATWEVVAGDILTTTGITSFYPPSVATQRALVRISDETNPGTFDVSDGPFSIREQMGLAIFLPTDADELVAGSTTNIVWRATRSGQVAIDYSSDGGDDWTTVAANVPAEFGSYAWRVPTALTTSGKVRVRDLNGTAFALSGTFSIVASKAQTVRVLSPNGGEVYTVGDSIKVLWSVSYAPKVWITLSSDGGATWQVLRNAYPSELGYYIFSAPDAPSKKYIMRVGTGAITDVSDAPFEIKRPPAPGIRLTDPNGGGRYAAGAHVHIVWTYQDLPPQNVALEYSLDSGATWRGIAQPAIGTGDVIWTVPDSASTQAMVRVRALLTGESDASDTTFTILPSPPPPPGPIVVIAPNGGERWEVGSTQTVRWNAPADVTSVKIEISIDGGFSFTTVFGAAPSVPGNGQYSWTIPNTPTGTARIRVTDATDGSRYDVSDDNFSITISELGVREDAAVAGLRSAMVTPNPTRDAAQIRWHQATRGAVTVRLYDAVGSEVRALDGGMREAGDQAAMLRLADLPSGLYRFRIDGAEGVTGTVSVVR
jgi:hypothetical protein